MSLALFAGGCASDDDSLSAAEWTDAFCTATRDWSDDVEQVRDDADGSSVSIETLAQAAGDARERTDVYVAELRSLGPPEVESADQIEAAIATLADEVDAEAAEIEDVVEDATGVTGLASAGREIAASVGAMFTSFSRTAEAIEDAGVDGELEQAFRDAEPCDEIGR
jgi:hypothetical protein